MLTANLINNLHNLISSFVTETDPLLEIENEVYKNQLTNYYKITTDAIVTDINNDIYWLSKEDDEYLKEGFKIEVARVRQHIESLHLRIKDTAEQLSEAEEKRAKIQLEFCKMLKSFTDSLILKIDDIAKDALNDEQINKCHFDTLKAGITTEHLRQIYSNLLNQQWICKYRTSLDNFIYLFTGDGFATSSPIHWKVSIVKLCLFLSEIVADEKIWAKASYIFLVKNKPVTKKVLGNSYSSAMGREITERRLKEIKTKITYVDLSYIQEAKRQSYLLD